MNECDVQSPCQHLCINLIGSFLCQCKQGYELATDAVSCEGERAHEPTHTCTLADGRAFAHYVFIFFHADIDECSFPGYTCQYQCVNTPGSYYCECPEGYLLQGNRLCQGTVPILFFLFATPLTLLLVPLFLLSQLFEDNITNDNKIHTKTTLINQRRHGNIRGSGNTNTETLCQSVKFCV